ncbi:MAG: copper chaperone PCu(A)C, partial [Aestuariivirgaceae bacterium]
RKVDALDVPAGGRAMLKPGGHHIMLFGLQAPLAEGDSLELQLTFEKAGTVMLQVLVKPQGHKMMDHKTMDHKTMDHKTTE